MGPYFKNDLRSYLDCDRCRSPKRLVFFFNLAHRLDIVGKVDQRAGLASLCRYSTLTSAPRAAVPVQRSLEALVSSGFRSHGLERAHLLRSAFILGRPWVPLNSDHCNTRTISVDPYRTDTVYPDTLGPSSFQGLLALADPVGLVEVNDSRAPRRIAVRASADVRAATDALP